MKKQKRPATTIQVLYEDNHCLLVFKPAGIPTVGDRTGDTSLLELARKYIKQKYQKPGNVYLGLVHRLDRPVSGVVLLARTSKSAARLSQQFRRGTVRKVYLAWVEGKPEADAGTLTDYLVKDRTRNVSRVVLGSEPEARHGVLEYRVVRRTSRRALLELRPLTGRSHQIRVQLASRGWPIVGDVKYGAPAARGSSIALHSLEISFEHPVTRQPITVHTDPPPGWAPD